MKLHDTSRQIKHNPSDAGFVCKYNDMDFWNRLICCKKSTVDKMFICSRYCTCLSLEPTSNCVRVVCNYDDNKNCLGYMVNDD